MPAIVRSPMADSCWRRGGIVAATKTATAATRTAAARRIRMARDRSADRPVADGRSKLPPPHSGGGSQRCGLVRPFPRELGLGASEVAERRGLLVDRPPQVELLHDAARSQLEM